MPLSIQNVLSGLSPARRAALQVPLDASSRQALLSMGNRLLRPVMTEEQATPLVEAGYARRSHDGGFVLTDAGNFRAMMEAV